MSKARPCADCAHVAESRDALLWHHGERHYDPPSDLALELRQMVEQPALYGAAPPRPSRDAERIGTLVIDLIVLVADQAKKRGRRAA
jgi:hypothetical protein